MNAYAPGSAAALGMAGCHVCTRMAGVELKRCPRCGAALHLRVANSLQVTLALVTTAVLLYVPANLLPVMYTEQLGRSQPGTIIGGVVFLWRHGSYPVAIVIFIASVVVPLAKIFVLYWLCWTVMTRRAANAYERAVLYRVTEFVGRWSMVDVFVVAILVALIQLKGLLAFRPGVAAIAFAGVVIITMIAAERFDPRLIWDNVEVLDE
jgi:paraquat-inducible protein A